MKTVVNFLTFVFCIMICMGCSSKNNVTDTGSEEAQIQMTDKDLLTTDLNKDVNEGFWDDTSISYASEEGASITIWVESEAYGENLINAWNKKENQISLNYEVVQQIDQRTELEEKGPSGTGADILMLPQNQIHEAVSSGILMEFSPQIDSVLQERLMENLIGTGNVDNKQYTVPIDVDTIALVYNKNLTGDFIPESFESLIDWSNTYYRQTGSWGFSWEVGNAFYDYIFLSAFGYKLFEDDVDPGISGEAVTQGLEYFKSLREKGNNIASDEATWDNTVVRFQLGLLPFTITGPWAIENAEKNGINVGVMPIPTIEGSPVFTLSSSHHIAVSAYTEYPRAAQNVLLFMTSDEGLDIYYQSTGQIPSSKTPESLHAFGQNQILVNFAKQGMSSDSIPVNDYIQFIWEPMSELFVDVWDDTMEIPDAQVKGADNYNRLIQTRLYK